MANSPVAVTEWASRVNGFIVGCGEASVVVMGHLLKGEPLSTDEVTATIRQAINAGQVSGGGAAGGSTSPANQQWLLAQRGIPTQSYGGDQLQNVLRQFGGKVPILLNVADAGAGFGAVDPFRGGHAVTILGQDVSTGNWIVADPNTQAAYLNGSPVEYSTAQLLAAKPYNELVPQVAGLTSGGGQPNAGACPGWMPGWLCNFVLGGTSGANPAQTTGSLPPVPNIPNPVAGWLTELERFLISTGERVGFFVLALMVVIFGLYLLFKNQVDGTVQTAARVAPLAA